MKALAVSRKTLPELRRSSRRLSKRLNGRVTSEDGAALLDRLREITGTDEKS